MHAISSKVKQTWRSIVKKTFVEDIVEGTSVEGVFLIDSAHQRFTKANKAYLKLVLGDKTGQIESVMWEETMEKNPDSRVLKAGDFADISGKAAVNRYSKRVETVLNQVRKIGPDDLDIRDFLPVTDRDIGQLKEELNSVRDKVDDPHIKKLLDKIFNDSQMMESFCLAPAAKNYHHSYLGGLLEHSVSVAQLALLMCDHYPGLNKSLLIAGALLHDIGKIREFNYGNRIDYSTEGRLKGHIVIGDQIVAKAVESVKDFPEETKLNLSHLILSHQGEPEYGAAVRPKTREAVILNIVDNADAKVNGWMLIAKKYGDDVEWTDYQSMFSDFLYLGPAANNKISGLSPKRTKLESSEPKESNTLF